METGLATYGCEAPASADDVHFFDNLHVVIQPGSTGPETALPARALLMTSLRPAAPFILLNTSMGDQAQVTQRTCGCPIEGLGFRTHLHSIRSFEKLTAGGMTFFDTDVIRVLEETLPARFGGGPGDYQLVEAESEDGTTHLSLYVHPAVGAFVETEVADAFLRAIGRSNDASHVMELQWRQSGVLRVKRRPPLQTASGKVLHLHLLSAAS
jgi:hypothetical protein